ncbi:T9SS type A sorting domain-containing protein [Desertivirga brevis]|uniref:Ig-like domain-containing protein n=1 Tax=Desertivirga brevis TaxID=2810310 RepID=UPI001A978348|nr:T9SS type A sorting domain-containing protein [Pedobacter sp. SYSU D00873]
MDSLIQRIFVFLFLSIGFGSLAQTTTPPPKVTSPVNLCYGTTPAPLTATGTNLQWVSPVSSSVGGVVPLSDFDKEHIAGGVFNSNNNKKTVIKTTVANVKIISVDYAITPNQSVSNLKLAIYNAAEQEIAESSTVTTSSGASLRTITNVFNYTLATPGTYYIGVKSGSGNVAYADFSSTVGAAPLSITGTTPGSKRFFTNIKYTYNQTTSTAPTPSTDAAGSQNYYVTQTVNGVTSSPATIVVNVNSTPAPTVTTPINVCQGSSVGALTANGSNLLWTAAISSRVGTAYEYNSSGGFLQTSEKRTSFTTSRANVLINSLEFFILKNNKANNLKLGIFDESGTLLVSSPEISETAGQLPVKVEAVFNYNLEKAGTYSIGIVSGSGQFCYGTATYPQTESAGILSIIGNTFPGNIFNINFSTTTVGATSTPVPSTAIAGSYYYYVTQTVNGCTSPPSVVTVNVSGVSATTPGLACAGRTTVLKATASAGYTLYWFDVASGGSSIRTGEEFTTPSLTTNQTFYVQASNGSCTSNRIPVQAIVGGLSWVGNAGTSVGDPSNWTTCSSSSTPNGDNVFIPYKTNLPKLSANLTVGQLIIDAGASIDLNGFTLTAQSITGAGYIKGGGTSKIIINASGNSTIRMDQTVPGSTNVLESLVINNNSSAILLDNPLLIKGVVNITGNSVLNSNGHLTLLSTESSNANIGPLTGGGAITGNVTVQAFMKGSSLSNRNFRTITSPVYDVSSPSKGFGIAGYKRTMYVTGPGGESKGFDPSPANGSTIKYYNEPQKNNQNQYLYAANATTEYISQGKGIYFYFRGKKDNSKGDKFVKVNGTYGTPEDVTMEYYGVINSGNISPAITYTNNLGEDGSNGFNLIGNPYPCVIDWDGAGIIKNGLESTIWVQKQNGTFAIYTPEASTNGGSRYLLPGQGFFIKANKANPSITFTENAKVTNTNPPVRLMSVKEMPSLSFTTEKATTLTQPMSTRLSIVMAKDEYSTDETTIVLKDGSLKTLDGSDISYMGEGPVTLTSVTPDSKYLAINYIPPASGQVEVPLYATAAETGTYSFKLSNYTGMNSTTVFLKDDYTGTVTNLQTDQQYSFDIDKSISNTFGDRFKLLLVPPSTLPVKLTSFTGKKVPEGISLQWATTSEMNSKHYEVQQSTDGKNFYTIGKLDAAGNSSSTLNYSLTDQSPIAGINYYRLKSVDKDGLYTYSNVISVDFSFSAKTLISIYPNPVTDVLKISTAESRGDLRLRIFDMNGRELLGTTGGELAVAALSKGMYILEVRTTENTLIGNYKVLKN